MSTKVKGFIGYQNKFDNKSGKNIMVASKIIGVAFDGEDPEDSSLWLTVPEARKLVKQLQRGINQCRKLKTGQKKKSLGG